MVASGGVNRICTCGMFVIFSTRNENVELLVVLNELNAVDSRAGEAKMPVCLSMSASVITAAMVGLGIVISVVTRTLPAVTKACTLLGSTRMLNAMTVAMNRRRAGVKFSMEPSATNEATT